MIEFMGGDDDVHVGLVSRVRSVEDEGGNASETCASTGVDTCLA